MLQIFKLTPKFTFYFVAGPVILFIGILTGRFKRFFQGVLILIIPISVATHFFRRPYTMFTFGVPLSPLDIVLIVLYAIWMYELLLKKSGSFQFFPKITIPSLSLMGISALSMLSAQQDPYLPLFESIIIFKAILLFLYVANHIQSKRDISFVLVLLLGGLFLQSLIAFAQRWLGMTLGLQLFGESKTGLGAITLDYYLATARVGGTMGHPNHLAKYVELLIPLSVTLLFTKIKLRYKLASGMVFICAFIVLLLTLSRGGWVCFAGSIVLILLLIFRAKLISLQTLVALAVVAVIFASFSLGFSGMVKSRLFGDDYGAAYSRIPMNKTALRIIRAHPILGVGVNNSWLVTYVYNPTQVYHSPLVHNAYLLKAAEMGIPGLLIFLWLLSSIFRQGLGNLKMKDIFLVSLNIGILAGMAALWAHWLVDPAYIGRFACLWVLTGLVVASPRMYGEERPWPIEARRARH